MNEEELTERVFDYRIEKLISQAGYLEKDLHDISVQFKQLRIEARTNFQFTVIAIIGTGILLAAMLIKGFRWV